MRQILITGSTDGIGRETALQLSQQGHDVVVHGRSEAKCQEVVQQSNGKIKEFVLGNFADLADVKRMAEEIPKRFPKLNTLVCNAGVLMKTREVTKDGFEMTFQVNHLAHFLLVSKLTPLLVANKPSRIIVVSSICHAWHPMSWDDLNAEVGYEKYEQYSRTKLENHLFAFELARRLAGTGVAVNVLEPGVIQTKLLAAGGYSGAPVAKGAVAPVFLAGSDKVEGVSGKYFDNSGREIRACDESLDLNDQKKLWDVTEKLLSKFL